jgi:flagellar motor protein MotB
MSASRQRGDGFAHSMTDLMAGVAVAFLLIAAIFMTQASNRVRKETLEAKKTQEKLQEIRSTDRRAINEIVKLRDALQKNPHLSRLVELVYDGERDPFLLTIVLDRGVLRFDPGDCVVRESALAALSASFGEIFNRVCQSASSGLLQSIALEGHTDNRPFLPSDNVCGVARVRGECTSSESLGSAACEEAGFANNVRLSAARAQNVFFRVKATFANRPEIGECLETKFLVAGRGPVEPMDGHPWRAPRSESENERNRRVVIKVRAAARTFEAGSK